VSGGPPLAAALVARARSGDVAGAIALGEEALAKGQGDAGLAMFTGMLRCRNGDLVGGIAHLRTAVAMAPAEVPPKIELARALLSIDEVAAAAELAEPLANLPGGAGREMRRVLALAHARREEHASAAALFAALVAADPADFESWRGLGAARLRLADPEGAVAALTEATRLRPASPGPWAELAHAYAAAGQLGQALAAAARGAAAAPADAGAAIEHARALAALRRFGEAAAELARARPLADTATALVALGEVAVTLRAPAEAEADYRRAIALDRGHERAWRALAALLERTNRAGELRGVIEEAVTAGVAPEAMALATAQALRAEGRADEAEAALLAMPGDGPDQVARDQLLGDLADRRGDAEAAFAAFTRANAGKAAGDTERHAADYRAQFERLTEVITPSWYAAWPPASAPDPRRAPLFVFGFPRSGTTLIDTLLGGHPDTLVLEEEPTVERVSQAAETVERVPQLGEGEIRRLGDLYFEEVERAGGAIGGRLIVDKQPLALGSTPLLHRLFPDAKFVFVERHPLDVVLSCFTMSAQMDAKVANFFDFESTARLYATVLAFWRRCTEVLAIDWLPVRYERLLEDPRSEMARLAGFAGLAWSDRLLSNESNAAARDFIGSPSYAQVSQPLYTRARGRWTRYRQQMAPVLPILRPWIERMGYGDPDA
jgi:tetratricopeptide (TPR) repeat protein